MNGLTGYQWPNSHRITILWRWPLHHLSFRTLDTSRLAIRSFSHKTLWTWRWSSAFSSGSIIRNPWSYNGNALRPTPLPGKYWWTLTPCPRLSGGGSCMAGRPKLENLTTLGKVGLLTSQSILDCPQGLFSCLLFGTSRLNAGSSYFRCILEPAA